MKKYWRSIEEYNDHSRQAGHDGQENIANKDQGFPINDLEEETGLGSHSRRDFLKMLGFGIGYVSLVSGCEMPVRKAIPYLNQPEQIVPGIANYYASTFFDGHDYCSILVKTREGRPIKIEGNLLSSITKGGTNARVQASVLNLYDMDRQNGPVKNGQETDWNTIDTEIREKLRQISADGGKIVILTPTVISPSTKQVIADFKNAYPTSSWIIYDTVSSTAILQANEANFSTGVIPVYRFDKADVIAGFNADFLGNWLSPVEYTKQYTRRRMLMNGETIMPRHFQFESCMSLTGSNADYRFPVRPSEEGILILNLYNAIAAEKGAPVYQVAPSPIDISKIAGELLANEDRSLVVSGTNDLNIQLTVNAINHLLGSYGNTIDLNSPLLIRQGMDDEMARLTDEMNADQVAALICCQVNPAYDYHDPEKFIKGLQKVDLTVSLSERIDETAKLMNYVCPDNNYLESWFDAEPRRGCFSMAQPVIGKVLYTRQAQESFLKWMGRDIEFHSYIQAFWEKNIFPMQTKYSGFTAFWNATVHDGVFEAELAEKPQPEFKAAMLNAPLEISGEGIELVLYEKTGIGDGRHANNPWLQELPDPVTMATWDNYICISPDYASEHGLKNEDVVMVDGKLELPVLVQPGQAEGTAAIAIGYGRTSAGKVADNLGGNAYPFTYFAGGTRRFEGRKITLQVVEDKTYPLAQTQSHHTMEGRAIAREATLEEYLKSPDAGNEMHMDVVKQNRTLYKIPVFEGYHWGMGINLNACTGCGNCVISCQAENNVAVIGKEQVRKRRIMHWIRIDRYYSDEAQNPEVMRLPVLCQHCDNAPCENVCPVAATPHSSEGLNQMAYNRCIGTRYCMNNCPYKVRRFNWFKYADNDQFDFNLNNPVGKLVLNPDVTVRSRGVVEKCSFCVQRIQEAKLKAKLENRGIRDGELKTACQQSCPGDAIVFGDMNDPGSEISKLYGNPRTYQLLEQIHTLPSVHYVTKIWNKKKEDKKVNYKRTQYEPKHEEFKHTES